MSTTTTPQKTYTTGEASRALGVPEWKLTRLYLRGVLAEPPRHGGYRVLTEEDLDRARAALAELAAPGRRDR